MDVASIGTWLGAELPKLAGLPPGLWAALALPVLVAAASLRIIAGAGTLVLVLAALLLLGRGQPDTAVLAALAWLSAIVVALAGWAGRLEARRRRQAAEQLRALEAAVNRMEVARERALVANVRGGGGARPVASPAAEAAPPPPLPEPARPASEPARDGSA